MRDVIVGHRGRTHRVLGTEGAISVPGRAPTRAAPGTRARSPTVAQARRPSAQPDAQGTQLSLRTPKPRAHRPDGLTPAEHHCGCQGEVQGRATRRPAAWERTRDRTARAQRKIGMGSALLSAKAGRGHVGRRPGARPPAAGRKGRACGAREAHAGAHLVPGHGRPVPGPGTSRRPPAPRFLVRDVGTKVTTYCQERKMAQNGGQFPKTPFPSGPREHACARCGRRSPAV